MRDKLIELIMSNSCHEKECPDVHCGECPHIAIFEGDAEKIADLLLADGWMRPPCKVGDMVYAICNHEVQETTVFSMLAETEEKEWVFLIKAKAFDGRNKTVDGYYVAVFKTFIFGKTVFLTREEAEAALRKEDERK